MFKSVSYYVQQLYATNKGTNVLSLTWNGKPVAGQEGQNGLFASSVFDNNTNEVIIKVVNTSETEQPISIQLKGMKGTYTAQTITLSHNEMDDENTLDNPEKIIPRPGTCQVDAGKGASLLLDNLPARTFRIYKIKK
jgi:alpha-L-arabinofuranosidase